MSTSKVEDGFLWLRGHISDLESKKQHLSVKGEWRNYFFNECMCYLLKQSRKWDIHLSSLILRYFFEESKNRNFQEWSSRPIEAYLERCAQEGQIDSLQEAIKYLIENKLPLSIKCFGSMIVCEAKAGHLDTMLSLFQNSCSTRQRLSEKILISCVQICMEHHKGRSVIVKLLRSLDTDHYMKTSKTFEVLLQSCRSRQDLEILMEEMKRLKILPRPDYWSSMIRLADYWDTDHELYEILNFYDRTMSKVYTDDVYNCLIKRLADKNHVHGALNYFERALREGITIYASSHSSLLRSLARSKHASEGHVWQWWRILRKHAPEKAINISHKIFRNFLFALASKGAVDPIKGWFWVIYYPCHQPINDIPLDMGGAAMLIHADRSSMDFRSFRCLKHIKLDIIRSLTHYDYFDEALEMVSLFGLDRADLQEKIYICLWNCIRAPEHVSRLNRLLPLVVSNGKIPSESVYKAMNLGFSRLLSVLSDQDQLKISNMLCKAVYDLIDETSKDPSDVSYTLWHSSNQSIASKYL